jgi:hypothetical protein
MLHWENAAFLCELERRVHARSRGRALRRGHFFVIRAEPEPTPILRKHLSVFGPDEPHKCGVPLAEWNAA